MVRLVSLVKKHLSSVPTEDTSVVHAFLELIRKVSIVYSGSSKGTVTLPPIWVISYHCARCLNPTLLCLATSQSPAMFVQWAGYLNRDRMVLDYLISQCYSTTSNEGQSETSEHHRHWFLSPTWPPVYFLFLSNQMSEVVCRISSILKRFITQQVYKQ